jgi:pantetheine-phosphate adenylyltransferase
MTRIAVVPGSFDPVTLGHLDIIQRAARVFDCVHVLVVNNPAKTPLFATSERVRLIEQSIAEAQVSGDVVVARWDAGLLVNYLNKVGANVIVKGIRSQADVAYETSMAIVNRDIAGAETMLLVPEPAYAHVSSSLVRQVATLGGDITPYVPRAVAVRFRST